MKITTELSLENFEACSGAVDTKEKIIKAGKAEEFEAMIDELYPDGINATQLNFLILWFNTDWLYNTLGITEEEEEEEEE